MAPENADSVLEDEEDPDNCINCGGVESDWCYWCHGETECIPICPCVTGEHSPIFPEKGMNDGD